MRKFLPILLLSAAMALPFSSGAQSTIYSTGFEIATDNSTWQYANSDNGWYIGTAVNNGGSKALYISNDGGTSNAYTAFSAASSSYAYRTLTLTSGNYTVSFDWQCQGEGNYDYLRVFLAPSTATFTAGNANGITASGTPSGWIALDGGDVLSGSDTWQSAQHAFTVVTDGSYKLVFYWHNDGSMGSNPPAAVDNVSISAVSGGGTGSDCQTVSLPFNEGFESGSLGCWTSEGSGNWAVGTGDNQTATGTHGGNYNAKITHSATNNTTKLISPQLNLAGASSAQLSFWYINRAWSTDIDALRVYYRTSLTGSWQQLFETTAAHETWTQATVTLPGGAMQVAFEMTDNYGYGVGIDDVSITSNGGTPQPSVCPPIHSLIAQNIDDQSFDLSWVPAEGNEGPWVIKINNTEWDIVTTPSYHYENAIVDRRHFLVEVGTVCGNNTSYCAPLHVILQNSCNVGFNTNSLNFSYITDHSFHVSWGGNVPESGALYVVSIFTNYPDFGGTIYTGFDHTTFVDNLQPDSYYTVGVRKLCWDTYDTSAYLFEVVHTDAVSQGGGGTIVCLEPSNVTISNVTATTATLSWTGGGTSYGIIIDGGTEVFTSNTSYTFTDLTSGTSHTVSIRTLCEGMVSSSVPITFTTSSGGGETPVTCNPVAVPYTWDFEDGTNYETPDCWTQVDGQVRVSSMHAHAGTKSLELINAEHPMALFPETVDPISTLTLSFWLRPYSGMSMCGTFSVGYVTNVADASTFVAVETYSYSDFDSYNSAEFTQYTVSFNNAPAGARIAFRTSPVSNMYEWYVDDITITGGSTPPPVTCDPLSLPFSEDFEGVTATSITSYADNYPTCWIPFFTGTSTTFTPHVGTIGHSGNGLLMVSTASNSVSTGDGYMLLPMMSTPLNQLTLNFWYKAEAANHGSLSVGYVTDDDYTTFTAIAYYASSTDAVSGLEISLPLSAVPSSATRIAFRWTDVGSSWWACYLDDISLTASASTTCPAVTGLAAQAYPNGEINLTWDNANVDSWNVLVDEVYSFGTTIPSFSYDRIGVPEPGSIHSFQVRAACGDGELSDPVTLLVTAYSSPATPPYSTGFESEAERNGWHFSNGTNGWTYGTGAANGGQMGLYISESVWGSNAYDVHTMSNSYAYKKFQLSAATYDVSFDWRARAETSWDYLRVFLAPATADLTNGYIGSTATPEGWIALDGGTYLSQSGEWQTVQATATVPTAGTWNLVFYWHNDNTNGTQPPAAIDNVSISLFSCPDTPLEEVDYITNCGPYVLNGAAYTESHTITYTDVDANGCNVNHTLYLTIYPTNYTTENSICATGSYVWYGTEYTVGDDLIHVGIDDNGCDYTEVLHLTVSPSCCPQPSGFTATQVSQNSVTLTWDNVEGVEYTLAYVVPGTMDTMLAADAITATPYTVSGLLPNTQYLFRLKAYCSTYAISVYADVTVTTPPCDAVTLPYTEDFESDDMYRCWTVISPNIYTGRETSTSAYNGSGCFSFTHTMNPPHYLISPELTGTENGVVVSFAYCASNANQGESFVVGYSTTTADPEAFTWGTEVTNIRNTAYQRHEETLAVSGIKYVAVKYTAELLNLGTTDKLSIDNFIISEHTCPAVQNLTVSDITPNSITLTWNGPYNSGATYSISQDGVEISTGLTATSYTATGLTQNTEYTFAVTAHCSATEASSPVSVTATTLLTLTETACGSYPWHGQTYTVSGTYTYGNEVLNLTIVHGVPVEETETACESFTWRGNTYSTSDDYVMSITDANGCPTTATLHLTINHNTQEDQLVTSCNSHTWHGNTYSSSGTHTYTSTGTNGCLHTEKLHLIINNCSTIEVTACESYLWHGKTLTSSGTYIHDNETLILTINHNSREDIIVEDPGPYSWYEHTNMTTSQNVSHTFPNANAEGCDHTVTLHLVITPAPLNLVKAYNCDTVTACDSYTWHGIPLGSSGRYILGTDTLQLTIRPGATGDTLASACNSFDWYEHTGLTDTVEVTHLFSAANGCDSVVTLHLDVMACSRQEVTACDSYTWRGFDLGSNGTYVAGNDTLVLDLQRSSTGDTSVVSCNTYFWNGEWRTESGEYTRTLTNAAGCDSVATLHLTLNACSTTALTICESYAWHGQTYTASGTYTDGTDTLLLTVNSRTYGAESVEACNSYVWHGTEYSTSGIYTHTGTNAMGCDSVATLTLTVNPCSTTTITACDSYTWHGVARTASGTYTDGTDTLLLTIHNSSAAEETVVTCDSYLWNSQSLTESGNYTRTSLNTAGCDSVATLHLTIRASTTGIESVTACDSYAWHGNTYTASGTHTYNTTNSMGCDSVATLHLTVNASTTGAETATACNIYLWNGQSLTESGNYTYNTNNSVGCDSVATLHLTVNACSTTELTVCDSYSWHGNTYSTSGTYSDGHDTLLLTVNRSTSAEVTAEACNRYTWHGTSYTHDGVYMYTTTNVAGCDSTVSLHLTLYHNVTVDTTVTACDRYIWNGGTYTHDGTYRYTTSSVHGCDSTTNLTLIVNHSVTTHDTLVVNESELPIDYHGTTITEAGNYEIAELTSAGCDSTIILHVEVNTTGINDVSYADINLYPNPTTGVVTVDAEGVKQIEVMDMVGRRVALFTDTRVIDISHLPEGSYVLRITLPDGTAVRKVVKR